MMMWLILLAPPMLTAWLVYSGSDHGGDVSTWYKMAFTSTTFAIAAVFWVMLLTFVRFLYETLALVQGA